MPIRPDQIIILTLGEREYELVPFLESGKILVSGDEMVHRADKLDANSGEEDGRFILQYQVEIPAELREKIAMVFTAWRDPGNPRRVAYSCWDVRQWVQGWCTIDIHWVGRNRLVRRRPPTGKAGK